MHLFRTSMGDLVSASFPVPSNPIILATSQLRGSNAGVGDLVEAAFPLPQNPIMAATSMDRPKMLTPPDTKNALVRSLTQAHTGPVSNSQGMGDAASTLQSVGQVLDNNIPGTSYPMWIGAIVGVGLLMFLTGGKAGPSRYQRLRSS